MEERNSDVGSVVTIVQFAKSMRSHSQADLKQRLYDYGQAKVGNRTNLPSVHQNNKGRPLRTLGLQFKPAITTQTLTQGISINRQQSAFLAGASRAVQDQFSKEELKTLNFQKSTMFQAVDDVQMQADGPQFDDDGSPRKDLFLNLPKASTKTTIRQQNTGKLWQKEIQSQLTRFKNNQVSQMFPATADEATVRAALVKSQSEAHFFHGPQFNQVNLDPYKRPPTDFGQRSQAQLPPMGGNHLSQPLSSNLTGLQTRTALGPKPTHFHKQTVKLPSQAGQLVGSSSISRGIVQSQSQAFLDAKLATKQLRQEFQTKTLTEASHTKKSFYSTQMLSQVGQVQRPIALGQSQAVEQILRQHFFIAKVTNRTSQKQLEKETSPQKHLIESQTREEKMQKIKLQTASLMRLNSVWGLEVKDPPIDIFKATITEEEADGAGVIKKLIKKALATKPEDISDLDMMISLFQNQPEDNGYFVYLVGENKKNPYDLKPKLDFVRPRILNQIQKKNAAHIVDRSKEVYYTLSKKGITTYTYGEPQEYQNLPEWLLSRDYFNKISQFRFFRTFQQWKLLKNWRRNITHKKRMEAKQLLTQKLFLLDDTFSPILRQHRANCRLLQSIRVVNMTQLGMEVQTIESFRQKQQEQRVFVTSYIKTKSDQTRELLANGMTKIIGDLRKKINEGDEDEKLLKDAIVNPTEKVKEKDEGDGEFQIMNVALEALGFKSNLKYGPKARLRKLCSRFLRVSYLIDFMSIESLANIYLLSIRELIETLRTLSNLPCNYEFIKTQENLAQPEDFGNKPSQVPYLQVNGFLIASEAPKGRINSMLIDLFQPPPIGKSIASDFNPTVHLRILDDIVEEDEVVEHSFNSDDERIQALCIDRPEKLWLMLEPSNSKLTGFMVDALLDGKACLRVFERWSRHPDLNKYQAILEQWDDRVCDVWEFLTPEQLHLNCDEWLVDNEMYQEHEKIISDQIDSAYKRIYTYFESYRPFLQEWWENNQCGEFDILANEKLYNPIESIGMLLQRFTRQKDQWEEVLPELKDLGMLRVETIQIKKKLLPSPKLCLEKLRELLPKIVVKRIDQLQKWLKTQILAVMTIPHNVQAFVKQIQVIEYIELSFQDVKDNVELNTSIYNLLVAIDLLTKDDRASRRFLDETYKMMIQINKEVNIARESTDRNKDSIKKQVQKKVPKLNFITEQFLEELDQEKYLDIQSDMSEVLKQVSHNDEVCAKLLEKKAAIQEFQQTLNMMGINQFENIEQAKVSNMYRSKLWRALDEWKGLVNKWELEPFDNIDVAEISLIADRFTKTVTQCERNLPPHSTAVQHLKQIVYAFKDTMPIVEALGNRNLENVHWDEIKAELKTDFALEERQFTLGKLVEMEVFSKQDEIVHISVTATQEFNLNNQLDAIKNLWKVTDFEVIRHKDKDAFKLTGIDKVQLLLDESLTAVSDIQSNRYVKRLASIADKLQEQMILMSDTIEQWKECQRNWLYLDNIFASPDIRKQRPKDYADFDSINRNWNKTMKKVQLKKNVKFNCTNVRYLEFIKFNEQMERIQKNLEQYLEEKRTEFPRFYFISNDELLQLLAQQQDIEQVSRHLGKIFDNLKYLGFGDASISQPDILSMLSSEGEQVDFLRPIKIRNASVEVWLKLVEEEMFKTVARRIKEALQHINKENVVKKDWLTSHCGQAVCVTSMILFTEATEYYIQEMEENPLSLQDHLGYTEDGLKLLVEIIRSPLTSIKRKILVSLITAEVHCRDIVEQLADSGTDSTQDFQWQQQLRYYMEQEHDQISVKQVNSRLNYGFEYMGATSRLVITPLTDRCWLTITGALYIHLGAAPAGPAGTGKTESTKDLAKGLGMQCIVFNCSEQVEYKIMARIFSGLIQSGSWACLDEFNRIDIEVLSVIAQQLLDIRQAKIAGKQTFTFNDKENMPLMPSCGVFITMNPGYAGRTELPDNLKVLFRPVSMMIPSYGLIAEVMLFAEGFTEAKRLSTKMVQLYKLASEQLSQQDHYDFGMRAVKSVLVTAGNMKRENQTQNEDVVLIRAMRDSNIPKFLSDDLPLFSALIQDLFPGVVIPVTSFPELEDQINEVIQSLNLQPVEVFNLKVVQLFDTFNVRFGVMMVGPTGGGKTTCYEVLAQALTQLRLKESENQKFQVIKTKVLNPKSISMGELYGQDNPDTKEWTDGLASKIIRKCAEATDERRYWCVFDGPVDALWIENMNTVLDDNMTLCLASGERIKLREEMRMLFEVQDLAVASPATVSRCGMVYMTPGDLGWKPYLAQWVTTFIIGHSPEQLIFDEAVELLQDLFKCFVDEAFLKIAAFAAEQQLVCVPIQVVKNICNYLEYFLSNPRVFTLKVEHREEWMKFINCIFGFSMIWAFSSNYKQSALRFLDNMFRDYFSILRIPTIDTVYEYNFDEKTFQFNHWKDSVPKFDAIVAKTPFFQLVVPTIDTMRYNKQLMMLTQISKPVFVTGETGTGKSMIVQNFISDHREKMDFIAITLNFSAQTDSISTQSNIESKLEKKRKKTMGAKGTLKSLIFIDDVNMPSVEQFGSQPPIELLRQLLDKQGFFDRPNFFWKEIEKFTMVCAAAPPAGGRAHLTPRFMRHFHILNVPDATEETLTSIFESILGSFLTQNYFADAIKRSQPSTAVSATIELYLKITKNLLPIPAKFHYTFNLRDVAKVFQGILMSSPNTIQDADTFTMLWLHECSRVFRDRLCTPQDVQYFQTTMCELLNFKFKVKWAEKEEDVFPALDPIFSIVMRIDQENKYYDHSKDKNALIRILQVKLEDYNLTAESKMDLVFFEDAVKHCCAILRILMQPRGNAMLIGVSGCGKQSLTKLATAMLEHLSFQVKLTKNFKPKDFRDCLKERMLNAGCKNVLTTFIMTDTQIMYEQFLEDVNNILNTGEITSLYAKEDFERMSEQLAAELVRKKIPQTKDTVYTEYIKNLRDNFHIILCMSPVGDSLRIRCRMFPSLVNCCTLDWFAPWPQEALFSVAKQYLSKVNNVPRQALRDIFPKIHGSVETAAEEMFRELRRKTYITPKSYLDSIQLYLLQLSKVRDNQGDQIGRLQNGIQKLNQTNSQIENLQVKLTELRPRLQIQEENATAQAVLIGEKKEVALKQEIEAQEEAAVVKIEAIEIERIKLEAEGELQAAAPALEAANRAVNELSKDDVGELKKTQSPNSSTELTLRCILTFLGYQKVDWGQAQKAMADINFLNKLRAFDKENIPAPILNRAKAIMADKKEFNVEKITNSSKAAGGMAKWCVALARYSDAIKIVRPKEEKVAQMQEKFRVAIGQVELKQQAVLLLKQQVEKSESELKATQKYIDQLNMDKDLCVKRLENAAKLTMLLADEGKRWEKTISEMQTEGIYVNGDVFLASAEVSYLGPFSMNYRVKLIEIWKGLCNEFEVVFNPKYTLTRTLGDPVQIRKWTMSGLPSDQKSIDNAVLTTRTQRWPLMIDPESQANNWLKKMAKIDNTPMICVRVSQMQQSTQRQIEMAVSTGKTFLLEEVGSSIDPGFDSILSKAVFNDEGISKIKFGDKAIMYDDRFRLMLTTKLANPHYLPEVCIKLTIIDFTVTFQGLEDQMLVDVISNMAPEVEVRRDELVIQISTSLNNLFDLQTKILYELAASNADTILDNIVLIETLETCRDSSLKTAASLDEAEKIQEQISETRDKYRQVATRGSILYFSIVQMSMINDMYQNSLQYVKKLFNEAIQTVPKENFEHSALVLRLMEEITIQLYVKICNGLFEQDKLIYSFLICTGIKKISHEIKHHEWNIFLRGAGLISEAAVQDKLKWLSDSQWVQAAAIEGFQDHLSLHAGEWQDYISQLVLAGMPDGYNKQITPFQRLVVIKILKSEMVHSAVQQYLDIELGSRFSISPVATLEKLFEATDCVTPIIFVLSQGVDPTEQVMQFAIKKNMLQRLHYKSLGQGQEKIAQSMIVEGMMDGNWVLLQNCHLFKSWMPQLELICTEIEGKRETLNPMFRLILTSMPVDYFPVSILQRGLKMTTDPPKGIKANLQRTYFNIITAEDIETTDIVKVGKKDAAFQKRVWCNLLFSLSLFHAVVQERRKFGPHGWNVRYEFSDADLSTSMAMLKNFLKENEEIPWDSIKFMTGQINYGGRVTDDIDRVLLMNTLQIFYNDSVTTTTEYKFSPSGIYYVPTHDSHSKVVQYIDSLPNEDNPEVFGMHSNANLAFLRAKSQSIIDTVLNCQPRETTSIQGKSSDETVLDMAAQLLPQIPELINREDYAKEITRTNQFGLLSCLSTVLFQEVQRYNRLLDRLNNSLAQLIKAVNGIVLMSRELDMMYTSLINNQVPPNWSSVSYPSLKTLTSWISDLKERVVFMRTWATKGHPKSYWLSGLFFPHGFITGVLQTYSRKYQKPIDNLKFKYKIKEWTSADQVNEAPDEGVYVYGLYLENAKWDFKTKCLAEQEPGQLSFPMPIVHFIPQFIEKVAKNLMVGGKQTKQKNTEESEEEVSEYYPCPVYKTSVRAGVLSTTGQSTNFILSIQLPCSESYQSYNSRYQSSRYSSQAQVAHYTAEHWVLRGTAIITMLDD